MATAAEKRAEAEHQEKLAERRAAYAEKKEEEAAAEEEPEPESGVPQPEPDTPKVKGKGDDATATFEAHRDFGPCYHGETLVELRQGESYTLPAAVVQWLEHEGYFA